MCCERRENALWQIECCVLRKGEFEWWATECYELIEGRNCVVGDRVLCAEEGRN